MRISGNLRDAAGEQDFWKIDKESKTRWLKADLRKIKLRILVKKCAWDRADEYHTGFGDPGQP